MSHSSPIDREIVTRRASHRRNGHVIIVGASTAGVHCAEALGLLGYVGQISVVGAERSTPYDRTTLSKSLLRDQVTLDEIKLPALESLEELGVELRLNSTAIGVDVGNRRIRFASGVEIGWTELVIATGARARRLPTDSVGSKLHNVYTVREIDDVFKLKSACPAGARVVIVGGSYLGLEIAGSLSLAGSDVTVLSDTDALLSPKFGRKIGDWVYSVNVENGINIRLGAKAQTIEGDELARAVRLDSGELIPCDVVVLAVGVTPNTEWLRGSGVVVHNGVLCDERGRTNMPNVYAIGDVANWVNSLFGTRLRAEHWTTAIDQGRAVAGTMLGEETSAVLPYFWSEQFDHRIQFAGHLHGDEKQILLSGDPNTSRFVVGYSRENVLVGVCAINAGAEFARLQTAVVDRSRWPA